MSLYIFYIQYIISNKICQRLKACKNNEKRLKNAVFSKNTKSIILTIDKYSTIFL